MSKELMNTTEMKEVISKRTACMKVFEHADHRFTAAIYGTPVHYMKDGHWEEIDNRLEAAADEVPADADAPILHDDDRDEPEGCGSIARREFPGTSPQIGRRSSCPSKEKIKEHARQRVHEFKQEERPWRTRRSASS